MRPLVEKFFKGRNIQVLLSIAGLALSVLLTWKYFVDFSLPFCSLDACNAVLNSRWSRFLGIPLSVFGMLFYGTILFLNIRRRPQTLSLSTFLITAVFIISVYLLMISITVIGAICYYCTISFLISTVLFLTDIRLIKGRRYSSRLVGTLAGALIILIMHYDAGESILFEKEADPELVALASYLSRSGAKFYGASWCQHCQTQKELFGPASSYLPYVECSPHGQQSAQSTECLLKEIKNYPTWIIAGRRFERVFPVQTLEKISGYQSVVNGED